MLRIGISSEILNSKTFGSTFAPLNVGQSSPDVSVSISSFTFCFACSTVTIHQTQQLPLNNLLEMLK